MSRKNWNSKKNGKPNRQNMTRSNSTRGQRREREIEDTAAAQLSSTNPPAEYMKYDAYAKDAAKLPFSFPLGAEINLNATGADARITSVPGLAVIHFVPSIGVSNDFTSAINMSSQNFWTYLRSIQKAAGDYDHQDITMMTLAVDQAYMFHAMLRRLYRILRSYNPLNRYIPRILTKGMGIDFDDILNHIADLREYVNHYGFRATQYAMPKDISLFWRHQWMCEGVYKDGPTERSQMYMFVPQGLYQYDNTVETGSQLKFVPFPNDNMTFAQLTAYGNGIINAMTGDQDFAQISGDMYQAYGGSVYTLPYVNELDEILPSYDETVLTQINNMTIMGTPYQPSLVISQNTNVNAGAIIFQPMFYNDLDEYIGQSSDAAKTFLNWRVESPSPEAVIDGTRLVSMLSSHTTVNSVRLGVIGTCGTEIVTNVTILSYNYATTNSNPIWNEDTINGQRISLEAGMFTDLYLSSLRAVLLSTQFDWFPICKAFIAYTESGTSPAVTSTDTVGFYGDVDNITPVTIDQMRYMDDAALMSLFKVPGMS